VGTRLTRTLGTPGTGPAFTATVSL